MVNYYQVLHARFNTPRAQVNQHLSPTCGLITVHAADPSKRRVSQPLQFQGIRLGAPLVDQVRFLRVCGVIIHYVHSVCVRSRRERCLCFLIPFRGTLQEELSVRIDRSQFFFPASFFHSRWGKVSRLLIFSEQRDFKWTNE